MPVLKRTLQRLGLLALLVILGVSQSALAQTIGDHKIYLPLVSRNFVAYSEWAQDGHDAQRTGYSPIEPKEPWTLLWTWNGPDSSGGSSCTSGNPTTGHCYATGREARTVTGGGAIFVPAGTFGLYALRKDGSNSTRVLWNVRPNGVSFNGTPAYTGDYVFAGGTDGNLYRVTVSNGSYTTYNAGSPINRSILATSNHIFAITESGVLHKVDPNTLTQVWTYNAGSDNLRGTGLAYSQSRDAIIFATTDLNVHAVNNSNGTQKWKVKPTPHTPTSGQYEFLYYWPVVAEQNGVVFLRMRLEHNFGLWSYPSSGHIWPNSNAAARTYLQNVSTEGQQNLFALNLDNGTKKFIPAVGYGGTEDLCAGQPCITTGPVPVIKVWPDGKEVAYIHFRNGQSNPPDGRWDSHMGEMVLDNTTISGYVAGDLRFVRMSRYNGYGGNSYVYLTDEQNALTMAGSTIFHAHWVGSESVQITNRASNKGLSYGSPIETVNHPSIIRRQRGDCANKNTTTHYTTCHLNGYGDNRFYTGPGFWTYWNVWDPPTPPSAASAYSDGMRPRYTYVSGDIMVVQGNGGELMVFKHSGP